MRMCGCRGQISGRFPLFENQPCTKSDMTHLIYDAVCLPFAPLDLPPWIDGDGRDDGLGCRLGGGGGFLGEGVECAQIKPLPNQS